MDKQPKKDERDTGLKNTYRIGCIIFFIVLVVLAFSLFFGYLEF